MVSANGGLVLSLFGLEILIVVNFLRSSRLITKRYQEKLATLGSNTVQYILQKEKPDF